MQKKKLLITGASGWLGKSLINQLSLNNSIFSDVMLVGSIDRVIEIENDKFNQSMWNLGEISKFSPTHVFHLAALTRDKLEHMSSEMYFDEYKKLNNLLAETLNFDSVESAIIVSSGAADLTKFPVNKADPYSLAKNNEETLAKAFISTHKNINILRVYSVTGKFMNKIQKLAFSNLIYQAKYYKQLEVLAENLVFRQYLDAEELMLNALNLFNFEDSNTYNSGGIKIEIRDLAKLVAKYYNIPDERIFFKNSSGKKIDDYTNEKNLLPGVEVNKISPIKDQIYITSAAV